MHCRNCAKQIADKAVICVHCGVPVNNGVSFCQHCGNGTFQSDKICTSCGVKLLTEGKDWLTTLLLNIFLGGFGAHRFYSGDTGIGVAQLLTFGGCGIWWVIDLVIILTGDYRDGDGNPLIRRNY